MNSVGSKTSSQETVNILVTNYGQVKRILDMELTPILSICQICFGLRFFEVMRADNEEKIVPKSDNELGEPSIKVASVVAKAELKE